MPKINLVLLTITEASSVDLHVSVTHLRQLRLVQDLMKFKSEANNARHKNLPQFSRMMWVRGSVSAG